MKSFRWFKVVLVVVMFVSCVDIVYGINPADLDSKFMENKISQLAQLCASSYRVHFLKKALDPEHVVVPNFTTSTSVFIKGASKLRDDIGGMASSFLKGNSPPLDIFATWGSTDFIEAVNGGPSWMLLEGGDAGVTDGHISELNKALGLLTRFAGGTHTFGDCSYFVYTGSIFKMTSSEAAYAAAIGDDWTLVEDGDNSSPGYCYNMACETEPYYEDFEYYLSHQFGSAIGTLEVDFTKFNTKFVRNNGDCYVYYSYSRTDSGDSPAVTSYSGWQVAGSAPVGSVTLMGDYGSDTYPPDCGGPTPPEPPPWESSLTIISSFINRNGILYPRELDYVGLNAYYVVETSESGGNITAKVIMKWRASGDGPYNIYCEGGTTGSEQVSVNYLLLAEADLPSVAGLGAKAKAARIELCKNLALMKLFKSNSVEFGYWYVVDQWDRFGSIQIGNPCYSGGQSANGSSQGGSSQNSCGTGGCGAYAGGGGGSSYPFAATFSWNYSSDAASEDSSYSGDLSPGWTHNYYSELIKDDTLDTYFTLESGNSTTYIFEYETDGFVGNGNYSVDRYVDGSDTYIRILRDGSVMYFHEPTSDTPSRVDHVVYSVASYIDTDGYVQPIGRSIAFDYNDTTGELEKVTDGDSSSITLLSFTYNDTGIETVMDGNNDTVAQFSYTNGKLTSATNANSEATTYGYGTSTNFEYMLTSETNAEGESFEYGFTELEVCEIDTSDTVYAAFYDPADSDNTVGVYYDSIDTQMVCGSDTLTYTIMNKMIGDTVLSTTYSYDMWYDTSSGYMVSRYIDEYKNMTLTYYGPGNQAAITEFTDYYNTGTDVTTKNPSDDHVSGDSFSYSTTLNAYDYKSRLVKTITRREAYSASFDLDYLYDHADVVYEYDAYDRAVKVTSNPDFNDSGTWDGVASVTEYLVTSDLADLGDSATAGPSDFVYRTYTQLIQGGVVVDCRDTVTYVYYTPKDDPDSSASWFKVKGVVDQFGDTTHYSYDERGRVARVWRVVEEYSVPSSPGGGSSSSEVTVSTSFGYGYDTGEEAFKKTITTQDQDGGDLVTVEFYDKFGRLVSRLLPAAEEGEEQFGTEYTYDGSGKLETRQDFKGSTASRTIDNFYYEKDDNPDSEHLWGRLRCVVENEDDTTARYWYDFEGNTVKIKSADNSVVEYAFDLKGRTTATMYWTANDGSDSMTTTYSYYGDGSVRYVVDAGGDTVSYTYGGVDGDGLKTGQVTKVSYERDENDVTYSYNDKGQALAISDDAGTISYTYDSVWGRVTSVDGVLDGAIDKLDSFTYHNPELTGWTGLAGYHYPSESDSVSYTYDSQGRVQTISDHNGITTSFWYYPYTGALAMKSVGNGDSGTWVEYEYDDLGRLTSLVNRRLSDNSVINSFAYEYNSDCGCGGMQIISKITREDGSYVEYDYDNMGRLIDEAYHSPTAVSLARFGYTYDKDGNRLTKKYYDKYDNLTATLDFKGFGASDAFDASNRLKEVSGQTGTRINVTGTVSDIGSGIGSVWVTPNDDPTKKVQADIVDGLWVARGIELDDADTNSVYAVAYDDAGNTATDMHDTISLDDDVALFYKYDVKGSLIERGDGSDSIHFSYYQDGLIKNVSDGNETETYYYDAIGRRYKIISNNGVGEDTRIFVFMGYGIVRELDNDSVTIEYFHEGGLGGGIGSILYSKTSEDTMHFYAYNHKGDVYALINETENITAVYDYDAWGNKLTEVAYNVTDNNFTFSTREFSDVSGLGHWPERGYDAFAGRWTRVDPVGIQGGFNLYTFVKNTPPNAYDRWGYKWKRVNCTEVNVAASAAIYTGVGFSIDIGVKGIVCDCCSNGEYRRMDYAKVSAWTGGSLGVGVGAQVRIPLVGRVGFFLKGPQLGLENELSLFKDCAQPCPAVGWVILDVYADKGGSFSIGNGFGLQVSYMLRYGADAAVELGWRYFKVGLSAYAKAGGSITGSTPWFDISRKFRTGTESVNWNRVLRW
jgi:RHS repeat-associated protein